MTGFPIQSYDVAVIGGGLVGGAIAYGLVHGARKVLVLDEGDIAIRPSRGNFGLVWVQGKGHGLPEYSRWSLRSAQLWSAFATELRERTGIDVGHENKGGVMLNLSAEEDAANRTLISDIAHGLGGDYDVEFMPRDKLAALLPGLGPDVVSGSYSPYDGHANPLLLLRALHDAFVTMGGHYRAEHPVEDIAETTGGYVLLAGGKRFEAAKVVLAAGHANTRLGQPFGLKVPVLPSHGQILVTERVEPFLPLPTNLVRQTREGTLLLGYTESDFGYDLDTRPDFLRDIAWRARRAFPRIAGLRVVRAWAALRTMTPDGFPVYEQSASHPGIFIASCHSGVTLAAIHASRLARWIANGHLPEEMTVFTSARFHVQEAA